MKTPSVEPTVTMKESALVQDLASAPSQRVATSALRHFADVGFHATTTRDIAQGAGVSAGALYTYFNSKSDILYHWMLVGHRDALRVTREALGRGTTADERVEFIVHDLTIWHASYPVLSRVVTSQLRALDIAHYRVILELRREIEECLRVPVEQGSALGRFKATDTTIVMNAIFALILDIARWFPSGRHDAERVASAYARLSHAMLLAES